MKKFKMNGLIKSLVISLSLGLATPALSATPKDTIIMARKIDDIKVLDPAEVFEWGSGEIINNLYTRLITLDPNDFTKLTGGVAESWKVSDDGLTYEFKIRPGLKFHSGNPVTAKDAEFSLRRVVHLSKTPVFIFNQLGWKPDTVDDMVKAVDDSTLVLKIAQPYANSLVINILSAGVASIVDSVEVSKHIKDNDYGYNWLKTNSAGSGAYKLVVWKPKDAVVMEANPDFYLGAPKSKRFIVRHIAEPSAQRLLLTAGDIDIARDLSADQIKQARSNDKVKVSTTEKLSTYYLGLNSEKNEILAKPKVWEALRWLVDYQTMANTFLDGYYKVHQSFLTGPDGIQETPYKLDVEKAKALLAEAGYPDGFSITMDLYNTPPQTDIAQSIQSTFGQAGIKLNLIQSDKAQGLTKYRSRGHDIMLAAWSPDYLDAHSTAEFFVRNTDNSDDSKNKTAAWRNGWEIPEISAMTEKAMMEQDAEKRRNIYFEQQRTVQNDSPMIMMFQLIESSVMQNNVNNFISGPGFDTALYWKVEKTQ
ncbi:ABC transporter substrate-binding protein [Advenella sp. WQ 585]|uniref:ABC transporter substrate-binding protein n=1 Tax=Advenella mandrilli TaxID=2800330 RepID=A0ABS1E923_9BURK|nr:ABC transporter substrate-binding protein [Advenella mandrilli]MBK1780211.1 ABC transporter substrate-binding protein [Advenella mandrilli]